MAGSVKGIRAGRAYIEVFADNSRLVRGLRLAERQLTRFGSAVTTMGTRLAAVVAAPAVPLFAATIKSASDAQESLNRFEAVFKDQAAAAGAFGDELAQTVGRSKYDIRDALATFQSFFLGLGMGSEESRALSQQLSSLALDFASFHNLSDEEAIQRFISALSGSSEVLDKFGINIKQVALQQELLAMGVTKSWSEVGEQEKTIARLSVIMRSMGEQGAVGDAAKTAGSFANQMKRLGGQVKTASVEIGKSLLPIVTPLVVRLNESVAVIAKWIEQNHALIATIAKVAAIVVAAGAAIAVLGFGITALGAVFGGIATIITTIGAAIGAMVAGVMALLSPIGLAVAAVAALTGAVLYFTGAGAVLVDWFKEKFSALKDTAVETWNRIAGAFRRGDLEDIMKLLLAELNVLWIKGFNRIESVVEAFKNFFAIGWDSLVGVASAAAHVIGSVWTGTWGLLRSGAQDFFDWFKGETDEAAAADGPFDKLNKKALESQPPGLGEGAPLPMSFGVRVPRKSGTAAAPAAPQPPPEEPKTAKEATDEAVAQFREAAGEYTKNAKAETKLPGLALPMAGGGIGGMFVGLATAAAAARDGMKELTLAERQARRLDKAIEERNQIQARIDEENRKREQQPPEPPPPEETVPDFRQQLDEMLSKIKGGIDEFNATATKAEEKRSVAGTFNANAVFGLETASTRDIVAATKRMVELQTRNYMETATMRGVLQRMERDGQPILQVSD